eukprot:1414526-Amphidinium_carterae.1
MAMRQDCSGLRGAHRGMKAWRLFKGVNLLLLMVSGQGAEPISSPLLDCMFDPEWANFKQLLQGTVPLFDMQNIDGTYNPSFNVASLFPLFSEAEEKVAAFIAKEIDVGGQGHLEYFKSRLEEFVSAAQLNNSLNPLTDEVSLDLSCLYGVVSALYVHAWAMVLLEHKYAEAAMFLKTAWRLLDFNNFDFLEDSSWPFTSWDI